VCCVLDFLSHGDFSFGPHRNSLLRFPVKLARSSCCRVQRSFSFSALASWPRPFLFACAPRIARCPHRSVPRVGFSCSRQKGAGQFSSPSSSRSVCAQARIWPCHFLSGGCSTSKLCLLLIRSSRFDFAALQLWLGFL
jgi:hypothetical protein